MGRSQKFCCIRTKWQLWASQHSQITANSGQLPSIHLPTNIGVCRGNCVCPTSLYGPTRNRKKKPELLLGAPIGGQVAGTVLPGYDKFPGWVNIVAIHPSQRRKGIVFQLMGAAGKAQADMACPNLNLQVRKENATIVELYEDLGHAIEDRVRMGKRLKQCHRAGSSIGSSSLEYRGRKLSGILRLPSPWCPLTRPGHQEMV
jgi:hypothetical protein